MADFYRFDLDFQTTDFKLLTNKSIKIQNLNTIITGKQKSNLSRNDLESETYLRELT